MGFIESVPGKVFDLLKYFVGFSGADSFVFGSLDKSFFLGLHYRGFFLAHGFTQQIGLGHAEASYIGGNTHDLFLIHNQTFGFPQNGFQLGKFIFDTIRIMFTPDKIFCHAALQRSGPIKRIQGDQVPEIFWFISPQQVFHPRTFKLENSIRISGLK